MTALGNRRYGLTVRLPAERAARGTGNLAGQRQSPLDE
jgi:hypothetical protein